MSGATLPLVSVIIPAYNAEKYIRETLESVLAQDYPGLEVIVVDDGSTDRTCELIHSFGDRVRYLHQPNSGGCSKPRNTGIAAARGAFLAFIDSDDVMVPGRIAAQVQCLVTHPEVGLVFSNYKDFDQTGVAGIDHFKTCPILGEMIRTRPGIQTIVLQPEESTEMLLTENFGSSSPMVRREVIDVVGVFDETLKPSEDYDFQYRVATRYPIALLPKVGWHKRIHLASMSSNDINILHYKIMTRRRLLDRETVPRRRRKLRRVLGTCYWSLAYHQTGRNNALAFKHGLTSLRFKPHGDPRLFARLLLHVLGRNSNRTGVHQG